MFPFSNSAAFNIRLASLASRPPVVDTLAVKSPIATDPKSRDLVLPKHPVDRAWMDVQIFRNLHNCHHFVIFFHRTVSQSPAHAKLVPRPSAIAAYSFLIASIPRILAND